MADRKYGRIFTMSDVEKIIEFALDGDYGDVEQVTEELFGADADAVRFKFDRDEPTFTMRARDKRSEGAIRFYGDHQSHSAPVGFIEGIDAAQRDFREYREQNPQMMKEPD